MPVPLTQPPSESSSVPSQTPLSARENALELMERKETLEKEIEAISSYLQAQGVPGLHGGLFDGEGFPRSDIDVFAIRTARHRLACLITDIREVSASLEKELFAALAPTNGTDTSSTPSTGTRSAQSNGFTSNGLTSTAIPTIYHRNEARETVRDTWMGLQPFARVDSVAEGSPAFVAGLKIGDSIVKLGSLEGLDLSSMRHTINLQTIANIVNDSVNRPLVVVVRRADSRAGYPSGIIELTLTPGPWSGRGLLGCHIVPC